MTPNPQATVILAFYNDVPLLRWTLRALTTQYRGQFEVLIADDGSNSEAVSQVKQLLDDCPFPSKHLWHEDAGFRKTIIMNRAVLQAQGEILIFVDADCVPQAHFIDDHLLASQSGFCSAGRRVDCFREAINELDDTKPESVMSQHAARFLLWSMTSKARNIEKGLRLPTRLAHKFTTHRWGIVGCNFSIQKTDLLSINGFDERHTVPWGAEDSDLQRRLLKAGIKIKDLRYQATAIHFDSSYFHRKASSSDTESKGLSHYDRAALEDRAWTPFGILKKDRPDPSRD
ncbi:MAG: glycosyltransferase [Orrella sp.]